MKKILFYLALILLICNSVQSKGKLDKNNIVVKFVPQVQSQITLKPNYFELGRKYGNQRKITQTGKIETATVVFKRQTVEVYDNIDTSIFNIIDFEWMDNNILWIDFSSKPQEFYMVITFDSDGLIFVNNENDPQPGSEYSTLYFKELDKNEFQNIYK